MRRWIAAGAGSGKTESLVGEILAALDGGFAPGEILALTFTRAAAAELKQRVRVRLMARAATGAGAPDLDALTVTTFHAFAAGFLHEEFVRAGKTLAFTLLDEIAGDDDDAARLHDFVTADAGQNPARWDKALGLCGLAGAKGLFAGMAKAAADQPAEFVRVITELSPAVAVQVRADVAQAALAALERDADDLGEVNSVFSAFSDAVGTQLLGLTRGEWPAEPQLATHLKTLADVGAEGFPPRKATLIKDAVKAANKILQGALLEAALEPLLPAAQEFAADRKADLLAAGLAGYDDLLRFTAERLQEPDCARRLAARIRCLLVDEAQDTDPVQARLIAALHGALGADGRIVVVGDEKQAIYRFRGADLGSYRGLHEILGGAEQRRLEANRRSVPEILNFVQAYAAAQGLEPQGETAVPLSPPFWNAAAELSATKAPAGEPRVLLLECGAEELLDWATPWLQQRDIHWRDCLFLADTNRKLDELEQGCLRRDIPVIRTGMGLWGREVPAALLNAAEAAADPENDLALLAVLRSPLFAVRDEDLLAALGNETEGRIPLRKLFSLRDAPSLSPALRGALASIQRLHEEDAPVAARLRRLVETSGLAAALFAADYPGALAEREALALSYRLAADSPGLREFAERLRAGKEKEAKTPLLPDPSRPGAKLLTIHGAKGLGEKVVFLDARMDFAERKTHEHFRIGPGGWGAPPTPSEARTKYSWGARRSSFSGGATTPGWLALYEAAESAAYARDRAALGYVALTRAKEWLILWAPKFPVNRKPLALGSRLNHFLGWEKNGERKIPAALAAWARLEIPEATPARPRQFIAVPEPPAPLEFPPLSVVEAFDWNDAREGSARKIRGALLHKAMELWPSFKAEEVAAALRAAGDALGISPADPLSLEVKKILQTAARHKFLKELQAAQTRHSLWRELPLFIPESFSENGEAGSPASEDAGAKFFRRGIADLVYREAGGRFVIVDYKTGTRSDENLADYREQLASYRAALAAAGFADAKLLLWFVESTDDPVVVN